MPWIVVVIPVFSIVAMILVVLASWKYQKLNFSTQILSNQPTVLQKISTLLSVHIRLYVFIISGIWGLSVLGILYFTSENTDSFLRGLVRIYGFSSLLLLFLTLIPGMVRLYFPGFTLDSILIKSRRAFGLCTFIFGLVHGSIAFIYYYSASFQKISGLSLSYQLAAYFAMTALLIFIVMAITSSGKMVEILTFQKWKIIHRFIYLAFLLSILHSFIRGTHLSEPYKTFSAFMVFLSLTFILLEISATEIYILTNYFSQKPLKSYLIFTLLSIVGLISFYLSFLKLDQLY